MDLTPSPIAEVPLSLTPLIFSLFQPLISAESDGVSTCYHLHFEVWKDKTPVSPIPFLQAHGVTLKP